MAVNGRQGRKKLGGLKTMPFILSNEVCDRFAVAGFNANMIQYLRNELHIPLVQATNTLNTFSGTSSFTPIIGALIADSFAGRFWTITVGSILYQLGMLGVTISAILPALHPPPCPPKSPSCHQASSWQQAFFYLSLFITAVGSGGIRPCVVAFGAEQLEDGPHPRPDKPKRRWSFFNLYFFCIGVSVTLALTVVVYIQDNVGWGLGYGIPTIAMFLSVIVFVFGYPLYIKKKPGGSPLTRMAQVVVAAARKRKFDANIDVRLLYQDQELDADITTAGRLSHTKQFKFLNRAAIVADGDRTDTGRPRLWRLSTIHRIEELKSFIRILPIWSVGIIIVTSAANNFTFGIIQAKTMNRHLAGDFHIPPATIFIFSVMSMLLTLTIYDRLVVPLARRLTNHPNGISHLRRIGIGLAISIFSNIASALVENRRRRTAHKISVFWLVPQYAFHGVAEGLAAVGLMEFLYDQSPESMKSIAAALYWLSISAGHYGSTVLVTMVNDFTKNSKQGSWLKNNIGKGRLDYFYWLVAGLQVLNFGYFLVCARFYVYKRLEIAGDRNPEEDVEEEKGDGEVELAVAAGNERTLV